MAGRSPRRRVLLVTNTLGWGGAETQLEHLASELSKAGHSVVVLALAIEDERIDLRSLRADGVKIVDLGAFSRGAKLRAVAKIARCARNAEVVHCTGWDATLWGRLGAFVARRPVVITEHTPGRDWQEVAARGIPSGATIALHNRVLDRVTYATVAVGAWQRRLLEGEGVRSESIVHIPNGVPIDELRNHASTGPDRAALGIPERALLIAHVARLAPQKGQGTTLRAVQALRRRLGDVRVLFVGGGDDTERAEREAEEQARREAEEMDATWATFLGFRNDVPRLLGIADLAVLPSLAEGLPMSLIEAVAVGTPIVATDVGDVRWFLETTGAGICVAPGDERAFTEASAKLLEDADLRARMSDSANRSAPEFDAGRMARRYEEVFEAAIESAPLPLTLSE